MSSATVQMTLSCMGELVLLQLQNTGFVAGNVYLLSYMYARLIIMETLSIKVETSSLITRMEISEIFLNIDFYCNPLRYHSRHPVVSIKI